eukprot:COSAG04_NODE_9356_length_871_cov_0.946891_2_plen_39_part_01
MAADDADADAGAVDEALAALAAATRPHEDAPGDGQRLAP